MRRKIIGKLISVRCLPFATMYSFLRFFLVLLSFFFFYMSNTLQNLKGRDEINTLDKIYNDLHQSSHYADMQKMIEWDQENPKKIMERSMTLDQKREYNKLREMLDPKQLGDDHFVQNVDKSIEEVFHSFYIYIFFTLLLYYYSSRKKYCICICRRKPTRRKG
tara:strand:- start:156 stop:644 length:489 start_codon:yes stop_codon:yes gene_type:complete